MYRSGEVRVVGLDQPSCPGPRTVDGHTGADAAVRSRFEVLDGGSGDAAILDQQVGGFGVVDRDGLGVQGTGDDLQREPSVVRQTIAELEPTA